MMIESGLGPRRNWSPTFSLLLHSSVRAADKAGALTKKEEASTWRWNQIRVGTYASRLATLLWTSHHQHQHQHQHLSAGLPTPQLRHQEARVALTETNVSSTSHPTTRQFNSAPTVPGRLVALALALVLVLVLIVVMTPPMAVAVAATRI
jgi:hypothetical protein